MNTIQETIYQTPTFEDTTNNTEQKGSITISSYPIQEPITSIETRRSNPHLGFNFKISNNIIVNTQSNIVDGKYTKSTLLNLFIYQDNITLGYDALKYLEKNSEDRILHYLNTHNFIRTINSEKHKLQVLLNNEGETDILKYIIPLPQGETRLKYQNKLVRKIKERFPEEEFISFMIYVVG